MAGPDCVDGKRSIPGETFMMGSPEGVGDANEHPKSMVISPFMRGQTEVPIGAPLAQIEGGTTAFLKGGAKSLSTRTIPAKPGEAIEQLHRRAAQVFVSDRCNGLELMSDMIPGGLPMGGSCAEMNGKGDDNPVVCLTIQEKQYVCWAKGVYLLTAAQFEYVNTFDEQYVSADQLVIKADGHRSTVPMTIGYQNRFGVYYLPENVWEATRDAHETIYPPLMYGTDPYNPFTDPIGNREEFSGGIFRIDIDIDLEILRP